MKLIIEVTDQDGLGPIVTIRQPRSDQVTSGPVVDMTFWADEVEVKDHRQREERHDKYQLPGGPPG